MATESQYIEREIDRKRADLGSNLDALQDKVRQATDWRAQFDRHPWAMMGAAAGAGLVLSRFLSVGGRQRQFPYDRDASQSPNDESEHVQRGFRSKRRQNQAFETFDNIKAALLASAATQARNFLSDAVPSFREHYDEADRAAREEHTAA